jgi:hypothetical protein
MKRAHIALLALVGVFGAYGCDTGMNGISTPEWTGEIQRQFADASQRIQNANDKIVQKYDLPRENEKPPFMSLEWVAEVLRNNSDEFGGNKTERVVLTDAVSEK